LFLQLAKKLFLLTDTEDTNTEDTDTEKTETKDTETECSLALIDKSKVSWYIGIAESLRTNDKLDVLKVMPFIQFCLKSLDKEGASSNENIDLKLKFVMLKNNLIIMNHFKTNGREEVQVNLFQKHLFLHQLTHNMTKDCTLNYKFST
jgi:hypothetical protein